MPLSNQKIKLISFDLDDTLWNGHEVLIKAESAMQQWMAKHTPEIQQTLSVQELRAQKMQFIKVNPQLRHQVSLAREQFLSQLFSQFKYPNSQQLAADCFGEFYKARQKVTLFDDIKETLLKLKQQFRIIAITNGNANLAYTELKDVFEFCLHGEDFIAPKPHEDIFIHALTRASVDAQHCLHVGDHPVHDMQGANNVGMKTCWLDDGSRSWELDFKADLTIQHINELLKPLSA